MSIPQLYSFNTTSVQVPQFGSLSDATVPDLHFGVLPLLNGAAELNYIEPFTDSRKRNRSDSSCSLSDFEISGDELSDYSNSSSAKRSCTVSPAHYTSFNLSPEQDFAIDLDGVFHFGGNPNKEGPLSLPSSAPLPAHSSSALQQLSAYPPLVNNCQVFGTGMQSAELPSANYKPDLMLNCDQDCKLIITEHPEEYYRARYGSEGVRAPLKGRTENYPTVGVIGPNCKHAGIVTVKLVHEDGSDHTSCSLDSSEERKNALCKKIGPFNGMTAEFEDLRIRREKRKEGRKQAPSAEKSANKEGHSDKVACLLFIATLETERGPIVLKAQSKPISLTTAPEPAELDWLEPSRGHFGGQEIVVIKGSKMTSPKVLFRVQLPDGQIRDLHGSVDKERSHQNVLLVRTPSLSQYHFGNHPIQAQVVVITGRNQMPSNPLMFNFIPNHICISCSQEIPHATFAPVRAPPLFAIHQTPGSPPTSSMSDVLCAQTIKADARSSPDTSGHQSVAYSPASSQDCGGVSVVVPSGSMPLESVSSPQSAIDTSKPNDDIMQIMSQLISHDYHASSSSLSASPKHSSSHFVMNPVADSRSAHSPYLADIAANSPSSDRPQYSPITPSQSPSGVPSYPDQMLYFLKQKKMITESDYLLYISLYREHNPTFLQAVRVARGNEELLVQMLASIKPDQGLYQTTQQ